MDKKSIEELKAKLLEISEFVAKLDPSMRAAAFEMLRLRYFGEKATQKPKDEDDNEQSNAGTETGKDAPTELADFIKAYEHKKPADNVLLLAAWLYSTYGVYPMTVKEIKELGDSCGLVIPGRPDNTMRQAKRNGKSLFNQQGKGWQPTVSGETSLKEAYKVKKGNKAIPKD
ncbi:MAG: hypothetical protein HZC50_12645 [Nitrospirae bacterium]|nr:hypothetical protein [Nitrospirota bacterium]